MSKSNLYFKSIFFLPTPSFYWELGSQVPTLFPGVRDAQDPFLEGPSPLKRTQITLIHEFKQNFTCILGWSPVELNFSEYIIKKNFFDQYVARIDYCILWYVWCCARLAKPYWGLENSFGTNLVGRSLSVQCQWVDKTYRTRNSIDLDPSSSKARISPWPGSPLIIQSLKK